jgi:penicillin-binding protein 1C
VAFAAVPAHEISCERCCANQPLAIRSPLAGRTYQTRGTGSDQALFFSADAPADTGKLFWFVDRKLIASGPPEKKVFFPLEPGQYRLTCVDDEGRSDEIAFSVVDR